MIAKTSILDAVRAELDPRTEIAFAYVFGSALTSNIPNDVDVGLFLFPQEFDRIRLEKPIDLDYAIPLEIALERSLGLPAHVQLLNKAPLAFRFRVVSTGELVLNRDWLFLEGFELLSRVEYFDLKPRLDEYMREFARDR